MSNELKIALEAPGLTDDEIKKIVNKHIGEEFGLLAAQLECREKLLNLFLGKMKGDKDGICTD